MLERLIAAKMKLLLDLVRWHFPERVAAVRIGISPVDAGNVIPLHEPHHTGPLSGQGQQSGSETIDGRGAGAVDVAHHRANSVDTQ